MKKIYVLHHVHDITDGTEDVKLIGIFDSRERAEESVTRFRLLPGFSDHPDGFFIDEYELNKEHWSEGFVS